MCHIGRVLLVSAQRDLHVVVGRHAAHRNNGTRRTEQAEPTPESTGAGWPLVDSVTGN